MRPIIIIYIQETASASGSLLIRPIEILSVDRTSACVYVFVLLRVYILIKNHASAYNIVIERVAETPQTECIRHLIWLG